MGTNVSDEKKVPPLVERKERFARQQAGAGRGVFAGREPMGVGGENRHGMPKLPVGQRTVTTWPVLDLGEQPTIDASQWQLTVDGAVERPAVFDWAAFMALPQSDDVSDFHCVTTWSRMDNRWKGVRFVDVMAAVGVLDAACCVFVTAYDRDPSSGEAYTTNVALEDAMSPDVMLVHTWEGRPLPREHGGPVRMITPRLYAWKGAKWIQRITLLTENRRGFWERRGYSDTAVPWFDDRYSR